jgi:hypothetical protein
VQNRLPGPSGASQCAQAPVSAVPHDPQKRELSRFSVPHSAQRNVVPWASRASGYQVSLS